jgi:proteasome beta subunit
MSLKFGNDEMRDKILHGTTTIGIVCKNSVVFATDTRAVMGYYVAHKNVKKVYPIEKHLAITIAGGVADAQNVVEILQVNARLYRLDKKRIMSVSAISRVAANILFQSRAAPLYMQAIIGGVDDTGPHIYTIDPYGSLIEDNCVSTGSGSPIAYGVLEDNYRKDMSVKEGVDLVIRAVKSAMKRDIASGNSFDVVVIEKEEGYRELTDEEKKIATD